MQQCTKHGKTVWYSLIVVNNSTYLSILEATPYRQSSSKICSLSILLYNANCSTYQKKVWRKNLSLAAPHLWINLPLSIPTVKSLQVFKHTVLSRLTFSCNTCTVPTYSAKYANSQYNEYILVQITVHEYQYSILPNPKCPILNFVKGNSNALLQYVCLWYFIPSTVSTTTYMNTVLSNTTYFTYILY